MLGIYARLSREDEDSNSINNQLREGKQYASDNNITDFKVYNEGEGYSGTVLIKNRPELNQMIKDMESGLITIVWMRKQDRLARLGITVMLFADAIVKNNIRLVFGDKGEIDLSDPIQMFHLTIMAGVDALKPAQQSKATKRALRDNAKEGKVWGVLPYGYRTDDNMMPYIDEDEAEVIKRIYKEYLEGKGGSAIATSLNDDNIPTRYHRYDKTIKSRNKYTKKVTIKDTKDLVWVQKTVMGILRNTWYIGYRTYSGETYPTPPIINEVLFNKVQKAIESRKGKRTSTPKYQYLLKGLIRCEKCGRNYYARFRPNGKDNFYMCSSKRSKHTNCGSASINIPMLESFIIKHLFASKDLLKMMESINRDNEVLTSVQSNIKTLENKLENENKRVNKYAKLLGGELEDDNTILNLYLKSKEQVQSIESKLSKLRIEQADILSSDALNNYKSQLDTVNINSDFNTLELAVNRIIENITISTFKDGKDVDVYEIVIEYKGLTETSTFYTLSPYKKWLYFHHSRPATDEEIYEMIREEIEGFEFAFKTKLKDGEYPYDNKPDTVQKTSVQLDDVFIEDNDVVRFNTITKKR